MDVFDPSADKKEFERFPSPHLQGGVLKANAFNSSTRNYSRFFFLAILFLAESSIILSKVSETHLTQLLSPTQLESIILIKKKTRPTIALFVLTSRIQLLNNGVAFDDPP